MTVPELVDMLLKIPEEKRQEVLRKHEKDSHMPARKKITAWQRTVNCKLFRYARYFLRSEFNFHAIGGKDSPDTFNLQMG